MDGTGNGEQVPGRSLRIRHHVKALSRLNAGKRAAHHISRIVSAAAPANDPGAGRFPDQLRHLTGSKVMELNCLAGCQLDFFHLIPLDGIRDKF